MKMKIVKRNILKIGYIIVVFFLWNAKVYITDINNIKEISAAFQEIFIFLSGSFLAIVGVNSFFPENRFIRSLRQLNVDLHLLKKFINLTFFFHCFSFFAFFFVIF